MVQAMNSKGKTGATGQRGATGPAGAKGDTGQAGGDKGDTGPAGPKGDTGPAGPKGDSGKGFKIVKTFTTINEVNADTSANSANSANYEIGDFAIINSVNGAEDPDHSKLYVWTANNKWDFVNDLSGEAGVKGEDGDQGVAGPQGIQGGTGPQGTQGDTGPTGAKGDTGKGFKIVKTFTTINEANTDASTNYANYEIGDFAIIDSVNGVEDPHHSKLYVWTANNKWDFVNDLSGEAGVKGEDGNRGVAGPQGIQGGTGPQGIQGGTGPQGIQGGTGPQGASGISGESVTLVDYTTPTTKPGITSIVDIERVGKNNNNDILFNLQENNINISKGAPVFCNYSRQNGYQSIIKDISINDTFLGLFIEGFDVSAYSTSMLKDMVKVKIATSGIVVYDSSLIIGSFNVSTSTQTPTPIYHTKNQAIDMSTDVMYRYTDTKDNVLSGNNINLITTFNSPATEDKAHKYIFIKFNSLPNNSDYLEFETSSTQYRFFDYLKMEGLDKIDQQHKSLSRDYTDLIHDRSTSRGILFLEDTANPGNINSSSNEIEGNMFPNYTGGGIDTNNGTKLNTDIIDKWYYIDANKYDALKFTYYTDSTNIKQGWDMYIISTEKYELSTYVLKTGQQLYVSKRDRTKLTIDMDDAYLSDNQPVKCGKILSAEGSLLKI